MPRRCFLMLVFSGCSPDIELEPQVTPFCLQLPLTAGMDFQLIREPAVSRANWVIIGSIHEAELYRMQPCRRAGGCIWLSLEIRLPALLRLISCRHPVGW